MYVLMYTYKTNVYSCIYNRSTYTHTYYYTYVHTHRHNQTNKLNSQVPYKITPILYVSKTRNKGKKKENKKTKEKNPYTYTAQIIRFVYVLHL